MPKRLPPELVAARYTLSGAEAAEGFAFLGMEHDARAVRRDRARTYQARASR